MPDNDDHTYKVGYGKPPRKFQYKPGQTGNSEGARLKKTPTMPDMIATQLNKKHSITIEGRCTKLPLKEIILMQFFKLAAKGHPKALFASLEMIENLQTSARNKLRKKDPKYTREDIEKMTDEERVKLYMYTLAAMNREEAKKKYR